VGKTGSLSSYESDGPQKMQDEELVNFVTYAATLYCQH